MTSNPAMNFQHLTAANASARFNSLRGSKSSRPEMAPQKSGCRGAMTSPNMQVTSMPE